MATIILCYIVWSLVLVGAIAAEEILSWKRVETSEKHSKSLPGFSGGLYGRITS